MKPRAPITLPVSARVSPDLKQLLLDRAADHQMSLCEYTTLLLGLATGEQTELDRLRHDGLRQQLQREEAEQRLAQYQEQFAWFDGVLAEQIAAGRHNLACLERLYAQYQAAPVPLAVATQQGFISSYLFATVALNGHAFYAVGPYAWRYSTPDHTHLLIIPYGIPAH